MIDPRRRRFGTYIRGVADQIGLRDWTLMVCDGPPDGEGLAGKAVAMIDIPAGRRYAAIMLSDTFLDSTPAEQKQTILHELLHCHFQDACLIGETGIPDDLRFAFRLAIEHGIDAIAESIACLFINPTPNTQPRPARKPRR